MAGAGADKKRWYAPRLRVFVRTRSEEGVLAHCKVKHIPTGVHHINNNCSQQVPQCNPCNDLTSS